MLQVKVTNKKSSITFDDVKEIQKLLKKVQSLIVIACKILRVIYTILTKP